MDEIIKQRMLESMQWEESALSNDFIDWLDTQGARLTPDTFRDALVHAVNQRLGPPHNDPPLRIRNNLVTIENHLARHRANYGIGEDEEFFKYEDIVFSQKKRILH